MSDMELSAKLDRWIDDNTVDDDFIAHPDFVYDKLLELETEIKKLQAENAELKGQSQWISVDDELPEGKVLISFLEQSFGSYYQEVGVGYYDAPDHYENPEDATGWRFWIPDRPVVGKGVTHWMPLPTPPEGG